MEKTFVRKVDTLELVKAYTEGSFFKDVLKVQAEILKGLRKSLEDKGFLEMLPIMISPITDPLNHPVFDADIDYYGQKFSVTKSMILHKQIATLVHDKVYIVSPNLRLETEDCYKSGRHLIEFVQVDMEMAGASREEVMDIMEYAIIFTLKSIKEKFPDIIEKYHKGIVIPEKPFKKYRVLEVKEKFGEGYEKILSELSEEPFWLIDIPIMDREFYDRQDKEHPEVLLDFDLIFPEGFGEGISGGEREDDYEQILMRMDKKGTSREAYSEYLKLAKEGLIKKTAGCGIGVERFTRWVLGLEHVEKSRLFAKAPGKHSI